MTVENEVLGDYIPVDLRGSKLHPPTSDAASSGEVVPMHVILLTPDGPLELVGTYEPSLVERYFKNRPTCSLVAGNPCRTWAVEKARKNLQNLPAGTMCGDPPGQFSRTTCAEGTALDRTTAPSIFCGRVDKASGEIAKDCHDSFGSEDWMKG
ncbi:uncharacterized protein DFL_004510 [Arthrobotrys flagrans]|uniref:Uncharacterized protein n=1 Tax=Arthrobotrys flagrans TaxID=97331 RepID=A0A437A4V0_ARTFL|nr:hypothetical protein DFL_004510 [Arthrobotrys flagrans]